MHLQPQRPNPNHHFHYNNFTVPSGIIENPPVSQSTAICVAYFSELVEQAQTTAGGNHFKNNANVDAPAHE